MAMVPVPAGHVATIVTTLEMRGRPAQNPVPDSDLRLDHWERPALDRYRALFRRVGSPWLWFSRLIITDAMLSAIIWHDAVETYAVVDRAGTEVGMLELDFRERGKCELAYVALVPELAGRGHGRWLMHQALRRAWRPEIDCVWVHTCSLDHPAALSFYRRHGFIAIRREVETFPDPRLSGHLPREAAPHVPIIAV